jgi:hypothetical protein
MKVWRVRFELARFAVEDAVEGRTSAGSVLIL